MGVYMGGEKRYLEACPLVVLVASDGWHGDEECLVWGEII